MKMSYINLLSLYRTCNPENTKSLFGLYNISVWKACFSAPALVHYN